MDENIDNGMSTKKRKVKIDLDEVVGEDVDEDVDKSESDNNQYEKLNEEIEVEEIDESVPPHVEPAVVIEKSQNRGDSESIKSIDSDKIVMNLSVAQIGIPENKRQRSASTGLIDIGTLPRKSSFKRNNLQRMTTINLAATTPPSSLSSLSYKQRPEMQLETKNEVYDVPKRIIMPIIDEGHDFMDMSSFYGDDKSLNFSEILYANWNLYCKMGLFWVVKNSFV